MIDDQADVSPDKLPGWRRAYDAIVERDMRPGDEIADDWLDEQMGIVTPPVGTREEFQRIELKRLRAWTKVRELLLTEHQMDFARSLNVSGYCLLSAQEQIDRASAHLRGEVRKEFLRAMKRHSYVDTMQLTDDQRAKHADAIAKVAMLQSMVRRQTRELPTLKPISEK